MSRLGVMIIAMPGFLLFGTGTAHGAITYFNAGATYLQESDSPFASMMGSESASFWLEDFEDGLLNTLGVTATPNGAVRTPSLYTDSVDGDGGGVIDGLGRDGYAFRAPATSPSITFTFDAEALGQLPTHAGLVWTDGNPEATVTLEAFNILGSSVGVITAQLGDLVHTGSTAADRFLGIQHEKGIAWMTISATVGNIEMDHLQYGYSASVVPLPPAVGLGAAGLGLVAAVRRRRHLAGQGGHGRGA